MSKTPPALPPPPGERLFDFPGRLSPMLVKELRQGMRTNLFVVAFILLQTFMVLCFMAGLADPGSDDASGFFWFFVIVTLLVVQPLRGFNSLSSEFQLNTIDLIQLTKLDAWRITFGKWTALNAQTFLFLTGVLPYLVMRYFFGNVNVIADLVAIMLLGFGSALASAMTIGCSAFKNFVLRGLLLVACAIGIITLFVAVQQGIIRNGIGRDEVSAVILVCVGCIYGCWFFLTFGASRIASLSENLATRKRLVALAFSGLLLCGFLFPHDLEEGIIVAIAFVLGLSTIDALTEPLPNFQRVLIPFRKNFLFRLSARFLSPGWISGIGFFLITTLFWLGSLVVYSNYSTSNLLELDNWVALISGANSTIFPLLIIHLFFHEQTSGQFTFGLYAFIQACLFVLTILIMVLSEAMRSYQDLIFTLLPFPQVLVAASERPDRIDSPVFLVIALVTLFVCCVFPLLRGRKQVKEFSRELYKKN